MSDPANAQDRRTQLQLRQIFQAACETLRPFYDPALSWGGPADNHDHLALMALKEEFPELSTQESYIVVMTVKRLVATGNYTPVP